MRQRILTVLLALGADMVVHANEHAIDEITVTATRRAEKAGDITAALTVVGREDIAAEKLITDALAETAGVFLQQTTPGQGAPIVRGLKGSSVLHLVDGIRLNNAIFRSAPTQYFALVPVTAIERVEIIRGTPTSLYGSDAVGGVVQAVTRVPAFESVGTSYAGEIYASADTAERARKLQATLDAGNREIAYTLSGEYLATGDRRVGGGERIGPSGYEAWSARAALSLTPDDGQRWLFDFQYTGQPATPRVDELVPGFGQTEPSSSEFAFEPNERIFAHGRYQVDEAWLAADWNIDLAWQRIVDDRRSRNYLAPDRRLEENSSDLFGGVISASGSGEIGSWVAGVELYHDTVNSSRLEENISNGERTEVAARFPDGSTSRQSAIFANGDRQVSDRNRLSGGLRFSLVEVSLAATTLGPSANVDASDVSGDVGWIFDMTNTWRIFANAGFGFRAPNVFDLGTLGERPGNRFNIPSPDLASEKVRQVDVGVRYDNDLLRLDATVYGLRYKDRITSVSTGQVTPDGRDIVQSRNAARADIRGAEIAGTMAIADNWLASAVLNYTWGEQQFADDLVEPADRIPPLSGRLELAYDRDALHVSGWVNFAGRQDRLSARDVRDVRVDPNGTAGWGSIGVRLAYQMQSGWDFALKLQNLADQSYRRHGSGIDAPGRNAEISVRKRW